MTPAPAAAKPEAGFSLIEALVALAVLGVAAAGLIRATEAHVDSVRALELRAAALWVAENRLAELGLPGARGRDAGADGTVAMLGHRWQVAATLAPTADPDLRAAHVAARLADGGRATDAPLATLDGFVDAGTTTRDAAAGGAPR